MLRFATLLFVLAVYAHGSAIPYAVPRYKLNGEERIVGGSPINITEAPYQVSFQRLGSHMCGGSIISEYHVLTAAHCSVVDSILTHLMIGSGSEVLKTVQKHNVARNEHHTLFNTVTIDYDVAVLKVSEPFAINTNTRPVALVTAGQEPADGEEVVVTGWGATKSGGSVTSELMSVQVQIVNRNVCEKNYSEYLPITSRMICAGISAGGKDSCQGDSGGPMVSVKTAKQVGIVSWGAGCARPNYPGVYTNVADPIVQEFIQNQLKL